MAPPGGGTREAVGLSYERTDRRAQKRARIVRWSVLGVVLAGMTAIAAAHQRMTGAGRPVGVDALCPFGGVETLFSFFSGTGFVDKTAASALVLLVGMTIMALVMRRSFCGQICPLGALQGLFASLGGKLFRKRPEVPRVLDRPARLLKYGILAFFALWTWQAASLVMRPYDPWVAYAHVTSAELWAEFAVGAVVLGVSLAGSLVYERFFCKYLCPTGALLGLMSRLSLFRIRRTEDACISCGACDRACPMNIEVSTADIVTSAECISCNECVNACPAAGALEVSRAGESRPVSPALVTGMVVGSMAVVIAASTAMGTFAWRMPTLAEAIERQNGVSTPSGGTFDTSAIKGYMSMREIAQATGLPEERFAEQWGVPESDLGKPMKDIKDQYGFSPDDVKEWVGEELSR